MDKSEFLKLLENAKQDRYGNLYYVDESINICNRVYFATVTTICDDFIKTYCYKGKDGYEHYDSHFTSSDDTFEVKIVNRDKKKRLAELEEK